MPYGTALRIESPLLVRRMREAGAKLLAHYEQMEPVNDNGEGDDE